MHSSTSSLFLEVYIIFTTRLKSAYWLLFPSERWTQILTDQPSKLASTCLADLLHQAAQLAVYLAASYFLLSQFTQNLPHTHTHTDGRTDAAFYLY